MPVLEIEGLEVEVDDSFLQLSPDQQADTVDEIAQQLGIRPGQGQQQVAGSEHFQDGQVGPLSIESAQERLPAQAGPQVPNIADKGSAVPGNRIGSNIASSIVQGMTLGTGDEMTSALRVPFQAGLNAVTGDGPTDPRELFAQNQAEEAAQLEATREANPVLAPATEIGGGLGVAGKAVAKGIAKGSGRLGQSVRGLAMGSGVAAGQGFASGDDLDDRLERSGVGAVGGLVIGAGAPILARGVGTVTRAISGPSTRAAAKVLNVSKAALKRIKAGFDDSVSSGSLKKAEKDDLLLDLSPRLEGQAEAIVSQPGVSRQTILDAVYSRRQGAGGRIQQAIDEGLGTDVGRGTIRTVAAQERKAAGRMFDVARKSEVRFNIDLIRERINEVADGIVGQGDQALRAFLNKVPEGVVDAKTLHFTRMALDDGASTAFRAGRNNLGNALRDIRREVDSQLKTVKGWPEADAAFAIAKRREEAFDAGRGVFQRSVSPDELRIELTTMEPKVKQAFTQGARDAVATIMGTARNDAGAAIRELAEKGWNREKLQLILGKAPAKKIISALELEKRHSDQITRLATNSRTAVRQASQKEFPNPTDTSASFQQATSGGLSGVTMNAIHRLANTLAGGALNRRRGQISADAARLLSSTGLDRDRVIVELTKLSQAKGRALDRQEIVQFLMNAISVPSAGPLSQATTQ